MIYSVYDYQKRAFDYYEGVGRAPASGWMRKKAPGAAPIPESLCAQLPPGAVPVGSGPAPRGIIATHGAHLAGVSGALERTPGEALQGVLVDGLLAGAYLAWRASKGPLKRSDYLLAGGYVAAMGAVRVATVKA